MTPDDPLDPQDPAKPAGGAPAPRLLVDTRGRPRSLIRVLAFVGLTVVLLQAAALIRLALTGGLPGDEDVLVPAGVLATGLERFLPLLAVSWIAVRVVDRRPLSSIGLPGGPPILRQIVLGLVSGAAVPLVYAAVLMALGRLRLSPAAEISLPGLLAATAGFLAAATFEELALRGYLLQNLSVPLGPAPAILITGTLFGLMHSGNPNINAAGKWIIVAAGILLGVIVVRMASLWAACALHAAWNITGSVVLGLTVSGYRPGVSLLRCTVDGPEALTGGTFGYEASAVTLVGVVAVLGALAAVSARLRHPELTAYYRRRWEGEPEPAARKSSGRPGRDATS